MFLIALQSRFIGQIYSYLIHGTTLARDEPRMLSQLSAGPEDREPSSKESLLERTAESMDALPVTGRAYGTDGGDWLDIGLIDRADMAGEMVVRSAAMI